MHRQACRLVDSQKAISLMNNGHLPRKSCLNSFFFYSDWRRLFAQTQGWDAQHITRLQFGFGLGAAFVHPHLARANDAIDQGFGCAFQFAQQKIVQALPRPLLAYGEHLNGRLGNWWHKQRKTRKALKKKTQARENKEKKRRKASAQAAGKPVKRQIVGAYIMPQRCASGVGLGTEAIGSNSARRPIQR